MFDMREPVYLPRDPDFIRQISIRDFDFFEDHTAFVESGSDTFFNKFLFLLKGSVWREMRANLLPAFKSSKMRNMFKLVVECSNDITKYFTEQTEQRRPIRCEMKDLFSRYLCDVIASCAFGLKTNSLQNRSNEFFKVSTAAINFNSIKTVLRVFVVRTFPRLILRAIDFEFLSISIRQFFSSLVLNTMAERERRQIFRPDMIQILMELRNGNLSHQTNETNCDDDGFATVEESNIDKIQVKRSWSDDEIVAQCVLFTLAGMETTPNLCQFLAYELALNQDIQNKMYDEIQAVNATLNGASLTHGQLVKLKYMDQVISEALRKWPPTVFTNRQCTKDYAFELDGKKYLIEKGKQLWIPTYSIQHDPKYFENPEKFDPQRFDVKNKHKIKPGSYIPFGEGPRACLGEY